MHIILLSFQNTAAWITDELGMQGMSHKKAKSTARPSKKPAKKSQVVKKTKKKK